MDLFLQIFVNSLVIGSLYGAIAMSFSLTYKTVRFFNLSHGAMAAIGGYIFLWLNQSASLPFIPSLALAVLAAGTTGFLIDRFIYAPQRRKKASSSVLLVVSLGVLATIEPIIAMIFGSQFRPLVTGNDIQSFQLGGAFITTPQIWIIIMNILILFGLLALLYKTKAGRMIRAISDDPDVARTLGIRTNVYIGLVFFISAALAGLAGILTGLDTGLQPTMGFYLLLKAVVAAIIGCMASIPGAFLGGFLLAGVENIGVFTAGSEWRDAIAFVLLLVFLIFRPQGILGNRGD